MKIKEFLITRYGPLRNVGPFQLKNFNLLFGKNEDGKTLTTDALVKLLLKNVREFEKINRVKETPSGYVFVEDDRGKEIKLPEKGNLTKFINLSSSECRNIFIVRNSDLSIGKSEVAFYTNITDRLTGLRKDSITSIKKELQKIGRLTRAESSGELSNSMEFGNIKSRVKEACELIKRINEIEKQIEKDRFDELEIEGVNIREKIERIKLDIENMENARKRELYEKGKEALNKLKEALKEYKQLERYQEDEEQIWRENERRIEEYIENRDKLLDELKERENNLKKIKEQLNEEKVNFRIMEERKNIVEEMEREIKEVIKRECEYSEKEISLEKITEKVEEKEKEFRLLEKRREKINENLKPYMEEYRRKKEIVVSQEPQNKLLANSLILSLILLVISLAGSIIKTSVVFHVFSTLFLVISLIFWMLKFQNTRHRAELKKLTEIVRQEAEKFALSGETFEEISSSIQKLEEEYIFMKEELERIIKNKSERESEFKFLREKIRESRNKITEISRKFGWKREDIKGYLFDIEQFREEYLKESEKLSMLTTGKEALEQNIVELKEVRIPEIERRIRDCQERIDEIRRKSGEETLKDYTRRLQLKKGKLEEKSRQESILESLFNLKDKTLPQREIISYWEREIKALEEYREKALDIEYEEKIATQLKEKLTVEEERLETLETKMRQFQRNLEDIERETNKILKLEGDYLSCKTCGDLRITKRRLEDFVKEHKERKDDVLRVMEIFEEIEKEEQKRISELFGKDSPVSYYFPEITDGLYGEVLFNQSKETIEVVRKDGSRLEADKLSGGAYDQLYLSIRLALGEKLLQGKQGFFIMDDPFIKADPERLRRQIEVLKRISEFGWQIIYFSAKGEIKEVLSDDIRKGSINYIEIPGIFS